jgi:catechol 2,3-dioxygenase-like lactoylglutathione lyase family enzyme
MYYHSHVVAGRGHVAIRVRDIEKTSAFHRDIPGFPEAFRMYDPPGGALGGVYIRLAPNQFIEIFQANLRPKANRRREPLSGLSGLYTSA